MPEVVIVASEYSFSGPERIAGGWTQMTLDNQGAKAHDLILFRLEDGKTMDDVMAVLQSDEADGPPPDWIEVAGQVSAQPGERRTFIADLPAGSYGMISFGDDESAPPDALQGMVKGLAVTEAPAGAVALPQADATIEMRDFSFVVSEIASGRQMIQLSNTGSEDHEAVIFRVHDDKTLDDVRAFLQKEDSEEPPPADYVGGMMLSPGKTAYFDEELTPGRYVLVCFLPSAPNGGAAHHELGMIQGVAVK